MRLSKLLNRCGCPDRRIAMPTAEGSLWTCCDSCGTAPCRFYIFSECDRFLPNGDPLLPKGCLALLKDCAVGCSWSARYCFDDSTNFIPINIGWVGVFRNCYKKCARFVDGEMVYGPEEIEVDSGDPNRNDWGFCHWGIDRETEVIPETHPCPQFIGLNLGVPIWLLDISGGQITAQCVTATDGHTATFVANVEDCTTYATLFRTECDPEIAPYLPDKICIFPEDRVVNECCEDAEAQCLCNAPGVVCDALIGEEIDACNISSVNLAVAGCDGNVAFNGTIVMRRYTSETWPPATLDDSLAYPGESCGAWWGTFSVGSDCTAPYNGSVGLLFVCTDDGEWTGKAYCYNTETETYEYQGDLDITREDECSGPLIMFTLPELDCCCLGGCEDCPLPETLTLTGTSGSLTLTYTGSGTNYAGSGTVCGLSGEWTMFCNGTNWIVCSPEFFACATMSGGCNPFLLTGEMRTTGDDTPIGCDVTVTE